MMRALSRGHGVCKHKGQEVPVVADMTRLHSLKVFSDSMREISSRVANGTPDQTPCAPPPHDIPMNHSHPCLLPCPPATTPPPLPSIPPLKRAMSVHIDAADSAGKFKASPYYHKVLLDIAEVVEDAKDDAHFVAPKSKIGYAGLQNH